MKTIRYSDPQKAYKLMNQWTRIKTAYEVQFSGKTVNWVDIMFEDDQPRFASVHYKTDLHVGVHPIDLSQKILLDEPDQQWILSNRIMDISKIFREGAS